jgi:hypothetical protein
VENYSIKRLEQLCGYDRRVDLDDATASLIALEAALEGGTAAGDGERQRVVAGYNEDDCRATLALRDWLEGRRAELAERLGQELPRPAFAEKPGAAEDPRPPGSGRRCWPTSPRRRARGRSRPHGPGPWPSSWPARISSGCPAGPRSR